MADEVDLQQSDFIGHYQWAIMWQAIFFFMDMLVMALSLGLYLCLIRALAKHRHKETPIFFFIVLVFFTSLVDDARIISQFIKLYDKTALTSTGLCRFETFVVFGNRLLQVNTVLVMLYYVWTVIEFKRSVIEQTTKKYFPFIVVALVLLEIVFAVGPAVNERGSGTNRRCYFIDHSDYNREVVGWLYLAVFPYYLPLLVGAFPMIRIALKLRNASQKMTSRMKTQSYIVMSVAGGYFFFHLLYYLLMLGREIESMMYDESTLRALFRRPIWFITRPMFALICLGWHIVTPLTPFIFDKDLLDTFPGNLVYRKRLETTDPSSDPRNAIGLTTKNSWQSSSNNNGVSKTSASGSGDAEEGVSGFTNPIATSFDEREFNQIEVL